MKSLYLRHCHSSWGTIPHSWARIILFRGRFLVLRHPGYEPTVEQIPQLPHMSKNALISHLSTSGSERNYVCPIDTLKNQYQPRVLRFHDSSRARMSWNDPFWDWKMDQKRSFFKWVYCALAQKKLTGEMIPFSVGGGILSTSFHQAVLPALKGGKHPIPCLPPYWMELPYY